MGTAAAAKHSDAPLIHEETSARSDNILLCKLAFSIISDTYAVLAIRKGFMNIDEIVFDRVEPGGGVIIAPINKICLSRR